MREKPWELRLMLPDRSWEIHRADDRNALDAVYEAACDEYPGEPIFGGFWYDGRHVGSRSRHFGGF